ncbi:MAG: discoidin domain-containing protein, partial [Kribbellaceae bacterium]|nr:discoidin domain-containing protein [Kribbellaceae bacterium]
MLAAALLILGTPALPGVAAGGPNLAAGKATAESGHADVYGSGNITDGNQASYWESVNNAFPQWVQVDLGSTTSIDQIKIKLPTGWGARTETLSVQGSTTGSSFSTIVASSGYAFDPAGGNTVTINFGA